MSIVNLASLAGVNYSMLKDKIIQVAALHYVVMKLFN